MKTIVGLFDSRYPAAECVRDLERAGYGRDRVSVVSGKAGGDPVTEAASAMSVRDDADGAAEAAAEGAGTGAIIGGVAGGAAGLIASLAGLAIPGVGPVLAAGPLIAALTGAGVGALAGGLVGALTSAGVPDEHARYYVEGIRRGGTLVTVSTRDDDAERVMEIMNRHHPVDIEDRASMWRGTGFNIPRGPTRVGGETATVGGETATIGGETAIPATGAQHLQGAQRIPVVEEELKVAKREVETGGVRVRPRMEERAVEEQVNLREERVNVERMPVDRPATAADFNQAFQGGTIEVTERAEEAVVQKEPRVVEEVLVGKEATERTETVRDSVRRTEADIQPVEVGAAEPADFDNFEADFRTNYQASHRGSAYGFDQAKPAYRYGYALASDRNRGAGEWSSVEPDARRRWEERNPGTWEKFKDAARYAYDRARSDRSNA